MTDDLTGPQTPAAAGADRRRGGWLKPVVITTGLIATLWAGIASGFFNFSKINPFSSGDEGEKENAERSLRGYGTNTEDRKYVFSFGRVEQDQFKVLDKSQLADKTGALMNGYTIRATRMLGDTGLTLFYVPGASKEDRSKDIIRFFAPHRNSEGRLEWLAQDLDGARIQTSGMGEFSLSKDFGLDPKTGKVTGKAFGRLQDYGVGVGRASIAGRCFDAVTKYNDTIGGGN